MYISEIAVIHFSNFENNSSSAIYFSLEEKNVMLPQAKLSAETY
jgi:hypothetical protein